MFVMGSHVNIHVFLHCLHIITSGEGGLIKYEQSQAVEY